MRMNPNSLFAILLRSPWWVSFLVAFGIGAASASLLWFYSLGFGAAKLAPLFARPAAWRVLDALIALVMWAIALSLLLSA